MKKEEFNPDLLPDGADVSFDPPEKKTEEPEEQEEELEEGGEVELVEEEDEEKAERKKRKRSSAQDRINKITKEKHETERALEAVARERDQLASSKTTLVEALAITRKNEAIVAYRQAHENGDSERMLQANQLLTQAENTLQQLDAWKSTRQREVPKYTQEQQNAVAERWFNENPWANKKTDYFDEEMAVDVATYAQNLANKYRARGEDEKVGTREFFAKIDHYVEQNYEFEDDDEEAEEEVRPAKKTQSFVASNSRGVTLDSRQQKTNKSVSLSPMEKQMAMALNLRDPVTRKKMSNEDHYKAYARARLKGRAADSF